ncbi:MBOAT family O-acyltransferase [Criblamydia sequanensis]|uniref:Poly(Beta-D-mannuronate) O-acetylase n=1 Tax=Candidatus Criblamydia sequanensis CRIB-18 TaxID=1437425 RepID=A0A090E0M1_9BACT|nr:MBOAT family O-acyltransferase [Criblamydia sequanensis]CDR34354.1 Putative poly(beta-D-mannuronate) O-acetylase [Criblamydia sequanensis CRIB-18]
MIYSSFEFIFLFFPIALFGYFSLKKIKKEMTGFWLLLVSLIFYGSWNAAFLPLLIFSTLFNWLVGRKIEKMREVKKKARSWLIIGIAFNLLFLSYYKYSSLLLDLLNTLFSTSIPYQLSDFPIGISFITFQQITYLVDLYSKKIEKHGDIFAFSLFVSFFPQLIAGPIVLYQELIPQLADKKKPNDFDLIAKGIFIFSIGLFKKVILADSLSYWVDLGFSNVEKLTFIEAWIVAFAYNFELYFDFSAYSDMAIGIGWILGIHLPLNFNSPLKADNIQEFWKRWHITFSRFIRNYLYIPLGGSAFGKLRHASATFFVFFLTGLWHGSGLTFILWGLVHGAAIIFYQFWKKTGVVLSKTTGIFTTFIFCSIARIIFRSETIFQMKGILHTMALGKGVSLPQYMNGVIALKGLSFNGVMPLFRKDILSLVSFLALSFILCFLCRNSNELSKQFIPNKRHLGFSLFLFMSSLFYLGKAKSFIYFAF